MTVYYTSATKVASLIGGDTTFTSATKLTDTEVEEIINRVEDEIDYRTNHAWRTRYSNTTTIQASSAAYEYHDVNSEMQLNTNSELRISLAHRKITTLASGSGDALDVFDGSSWVDYLSTKTEGMASDYWLDYDAGVLYLRTYYSDGEKRIRIKYRYGESAVPLDIQAACTKMVASEILKQDDASFLVPESGQNIPLPDKAYRWKTQADELIARRTDFKALW